MANAKNNEQGPRPANAAGKDPVALYRFKVRTADGRELTSAVTVVDPNGASAGGGSAGDDQGGADEEIAEDAKPADTKPAQVYRFRVRTAEGRELTSAVAVVAPVRPAPRKKRAAKSPAGQGKLSAPQWSSAKKNFSHQEAVSMSVSAPGLEGRSVRFVVEHLDGGKWTQFGSSEAKVKGGRAEASAPVQHPSGSGKSSSGSIAPARVRFRAELV